MKTNNVEEIGPRAFARPDIKPDIKPGDLVFVNWANDQTYKGTIQKKLRKHWEVKIEDDNWYYRTNMASVPGHALVKRNYL